MYECCRIAVSQHNQISTARDTSGYCLPRLQRSEPLLAKALPLLAKALWR